MSRYKYLFLDDRWIDSTYALHRNIGSIEKDPHNPLLVADQPWEGGLKLYGTVLYDDDQYRMWYQMVNFRCPDVQWATGVGYAESRDGIHWDKPRIGIKHPQHGKTNVVVCSAGRSHLCSPSVTLDKSAKRSKRYKMMFYDSMSEKNLAKHGSPFPPDISVPGWRAIDGEGMFIATSADGIKWKTSPTPAFPGPSDVASMSLTSEGNYISAFKTSVRQDRHFRVLATASSNDGLNWLQHGIALEPDWLDPPGTEFYGMSVFEYFGNYIGLINVYHNAPDDKSLDIQLAISHDGIHWKRACERKTFIHRGHTGAWDAGALFTASDLLPGGKKHKGKMMLYYSGMNARHDDFRYKEWSVGRLFIREDGFACLESKYFPGELKTTTLVPSGNQLEVSADILRGRIHATVHDALSGEELGCTITLSHKKGSSHKLPWKESVIITGREVFLRLHLTNVSLYSFSFFKADH